MASPRPRRRRRAARVAVFVAVAAAALVVVVGLAVRALAPRAPADPLAALSARYGASEVVDRHGETLGRLVADHRQQGLFLGLDAVSPRLVATTLAAEDGRFFRHPGVDVLAIARALGANLRAGRVVSGASTLSQQLARMLAPGPRNLRSKLREAAVALDLERRFDKRTLLGWYLSVAPYGGLLRGVHSASIAHFGRPAAELSWLQAAVLAVVPRAPERLDPRRHPERARRKAEALLRRMAADGLLDDAELADALAERLDIASSASPFEAPHALALVDAATAGRPTRVHTTLDAGLQRDVAAIVTAHGARLRRAGADNAAAVVLDASDGAILAMVGSIDWHDVGRLGANNGALARRQPGSALKPFVYALHFDDGGGPADMLLDVETHFATEDGDWQPDNYARRFHGPVRARLALANSLNVPAVRLAGHVGLPRLHETLRRAGIGGLDARSDRYGLGLALGDADISLLDLAGAYTAFANAGAAVDPYLVARVVAADGRVAERDAVAPVALFGADAAWQVYDVLADDHARSPAFGRDGPLTTGLDVAVKTGTSKGYRDAVAVAVSAEVVVAVWVGNFDGRVTDGQTGARGAGPLLADVLGRLARSVPLRRPARPEGLLQAEVCALSGGLPTTRCAHRVHEWIARAAHAPAPCSLHQPGGLALPAEARPWARHVGVSLASAASGRAAPATTLRIVAPQDGARFWRDSSRALDAQAVALQAESEPAGALVQWYVDDAPLGSPGPAERALTWTPTRGHHRVEVRALRGAAAGQGGASDAVRFDVLGLARVGQTSAMAPE